MRWPPPTASFCYLDSTDELEALLLEARRRLEAEEGSRGAGYTSGRALGYAVANYRGRGRRLGDRIRASSPPQPARRSLGSPPTDLVHLYISLITGSRPAGRGAGDRRTPLCRDAVALGCCSAAPGYSPCSTAARKPGRTPGEADARGRASRAAPAGSRWHLRRDLDPRRRPRGRESTAAHRLRLARGDRAARVSLHLRADART